MTQSTTIRKLTSRTGQAIAAGLAISSLSILMSLGAIELSFRLRERGQESILSRRFITFTPKRSRAQSELLLLGIGESTMMGGPSNFGPLTVLAKILENNNPGYRVEHQLVAGGGAVLWRLLDGLEAALSRYPDLIVVAAGHNDFLGSWGGNQGCLNYHLENTWSDWSATNRFFQQRVGYKTISEIPESPRNLFDVPVVCQALWKQTIRQYESALRILAAFAREHAIPMIMIFPAGNEASWNPNRSVYRGAESDRADFELLYRWGRHHAVYNHYDEAKLCFEEAARIDPAFADLNFQLGKIYRSKGLSAAATLAFEKAKENDGYPFRALNAQRDAMQRVSQDYGFPVVDMRSLLLQHSPKGSYLDHNLFQDMHHPTLHGYYLLIRELERIVQLKTLLPGIRRSNDSFSFEQMLALSEFDRTKWVELVISMVHWHNGARLISFDSQMRTELLLGQLAILRQLDSRLYADKFTAMTAEARKAWRSAQAIWAAVPSGVLKRPHACRQESFAMGVPPEGQPSMGSWFDRSSLHREYGWLDAALHSQSYRPKVHISGVPSTYIFASPCCMPRDGRGINAETKLVAKGKEYMRGFVAHPYGDLGSRVDFDLGGHFSVFRTSLSLADTSGHLGSVECTVHGDGETLFRSPLIQGTDEPRQIELNVAGVRVLSLSCSSTLDGEANDHIAWLNPELT